MILITNLGRCLSHVSHCHMFLKKTNKNVTEQMTSNNVLAQIFLALWTLNPGAASSCSAVGIHAIPACIRKQHSAVYLLIVWGHFAIPIITVTMQQSPFLFSSETWDAALNSLSLSVLVMIFASFSDSFKYFHTADTFAALVRASIWSRHVIAWYNVFGLFAYSISVAEHSVHA